jgi:hypothetical protein
LTAVSSLSVSANRGDVAEGPTTALELQKRPKLPARLGCAGGAYFKSDPRNKLQRIMQFVRSEVLKAVTISNAVFCDVMPCGSSKNRRFGESCQLYRQGDKNRRDNQQR